MKSVHQYIYIILTIFLTALPVRAQISVSSDDYSPILINPSSSSGLKSVWVVYDASNISIYYENADTNIKWYKFSKLGAAYAEEIGDVITANGKSILQHPEGDMGYAVEVNGTTTYFWIVNYKTAELKINGLSFSEESDCGTTIIDIDGSSPILAYYSINGQRISIDRNIKLSYLSLQWNAEQTEYEQIEVERDIASFSQSITTAAPLCNTTFTLRGDHFLETWGMPINIESDIYYTTAVEVNATATRTNPDNKGSDLGGSAPAIIDFEGYFTDATIFREWQISADGDFNEILYRFSDDKITYTFNESGTFYARFVGANADGNCESTSESFEISIGESRLECPNAFSPESDIESARVWRVSYNSIVEFECFIFNRYGLQLYSYTDPAGGWDGKYKGKTVGTGVYFYVITARGADGKKYNLKGDINILKLKENQ